MTATLQPTISLSALLGDALSRCQQRTPILAPPSTQREQPTWRVRPMAPSAEPEQPRYSVDEIRTRMRAILDGYRKGDKRGVCVLSSDPGTGKTTLIVEFAEALAAQGARVLYLAPRHDMFDTVLAMAKRPQWWQHWLPRSSKGDTPTCRHAEAMSKWLARGYQAVQLCKNRKICGLHYMSKECAYYAQKDVKAPIVFGQHQHLVNIPDIESFDWIIGDEFPLAAILHDWTIPASHVLPPGMDRDDDLTMVISALSDAAIRGAALSGAGLLDELGGAQRVLEACERFVGAADLFEPPPVHDLKDIDNAPYFHLPALGALLYQEATEAVAGRPYVARVLVHSGGVDLLCRRKMHPKLATVPCVWLDGTANEEIYSAIFGPRPVEIHTLRGHLQGQLVQVADRNHTISSVLKDGDPTAKGNDLMRAVDFLRDRHPGAAVISYKAIVDGLRNTPALNFSSPGSNALENCETLIVAGTPMPQPSQIHRIACMLYDLEMRPFDTTWGAIERSYGGQSYGRDASTYTRDPRLAGIVEILRESKIVQAIHRVRPLLYPRTIYLLTGLPIPGLRPTQIVTTAQLFGAPTSGDTPDARPLVMDAYRWAEISGFVQVLEADQGYCTVQDIAAAYGLSMPTARKYLHAIAEQLGWEVFEATRSGRGRPPLAIRK